VVDSARGWQQGLVLFAGFYVDHCYRSSGMRGPQIGFTWEGLKITESRGQVAGPRWDALADKKCH